MAKMGRPKIEIDKETFEKLCVILCTREDIAGWFKCSHDTVERWCHDTYSETFASIYKKLSSGGKVSLRRKQYETAMGGNVPLLIWLGKQHLDQHDTQRIDSKLELNDKTKAIVPTGDQLLEAMANDPAFKNKVKK